MKFLVVIPARFESTRLPGKPLIDLLGKSMIQRVYEQCIKAVSSDKVLIATEDQRIVDHCLEKGLNVVLTSKNCLTGTDRVAEVAEKYQADYYINVQGDEPIFDPDDITKIIQKLSIDNAVIFNGYCTIDSKEQYHSLTIPKVVFRPDGRLLYMSRIGIPGNKEGEFKKAWRQVCIYAFPKKSLIDFSSHKGKTPLELEEDIEILRFLEMGYDVQMIELSSNSIAIDTLEDVEKVINKLQLNVF